MRVIHLINAFNRGGVEKWLLNMLAAVPRHSCEFDVCCKGAGLGPWAPQAVQHGARIYHCPLRPSQIGFIRGLRRILLENHYDLVHNHLGIYAGLAVWVAQNVGTPIITTFHSSTFPAASELLALPGLSQLRHLYAHFSIKYAIRHSDMLTAVSTGVLDDMVPARIGPEAEICSHPSWYRNPGIGHRRGKSFISGLSGMGGWDASGDPCGAVFQAKEPFWSARHI